MLAGSVALTPAAPPVKNELFLIGILVEEGVKLLDNFRDLTFWQGDPLLSRAGIHE